MLKLRRDFGILLKHNELNVTHKIAQALGNRLLESVASLDDVGDGLCTSLERTEGWVCFGNRCALALSRRDWTQQVGFVRECFLGASQPTLDVVDLGLRDVGILKNLACTLALGLEPRVFGDFQQLLDGVAALGTLIVLSFFELGLVSKLTFVQRS